MFAFLLSAALLGADPAAVGENAASVRLTDLSIPEVKQEMLRRMQRQSQAQRRREQQQAVADLVDFFRQIDADPRTAKSVMLREYRDQVRRRLILLKKDFQIASAVIRNEEAIQRKSNPLSPEEQKLLDCAQLGVALTGDTMGGPAAYWGQPGAMGGAAGSADYGEELVDLIQQTIDPDAWDVAGGSSSIRYYAPLRVLVVSGPSELHHQVGGLLDALRDAGR